MGMHELEELGWLASKNHASSMISSLVVSASVPPACEERHAAVTHRLRHGRVAEACKQENGFGHVSYTVLLEDPQSRTHTKALFKPRVEGDCEGWHRVPIEVVAYQLNLLLGMDVVPPAVFRQDCDVDWTHYEHGGVFIYWCNNTRELDTVPASEWSVRPDALLSDTRILDVLLQNSDRHHGHFLYGEHWAEGSCSAPGRWRGRPSPILIDHAAGFRSGAYVCLDHENAFMTGPTRRISAKTYLRLRFLTHESLRAVVGEYLSADEISQLLRRRDHVLQFFDALVAQEGYSSVVIEDTTNTPAPTGTKQSALC